VKEREDTICAVRYALMSLRYAKTASQVRDFGRDIRYPKTGWC
jgi:hypothetical protein